MNIVLDASAVAAWLLPSQYTQAAANLLEDRKRQDQFCAPHIFPVEVRSLCLSAERRQGLRIDETDQIILGLDALGVEIVNLSNGVDMRSAMGVARMEGLTIYDALYLHLAVERQAALASRDKALLAAAERRDVVIFNLLEGP